MAAALAVLKDKACKPEIKEVPADSPSCLQTWSGAKTVYWIVDLQSGMYIDKDLASVKHFFVEEDFSLLPDPLQGSTLIGVECPLFTSAALEPESTDKAGRASYMQVRGQPNLTLLESGDTSQQEQPQVACPSESMAVANHNMLCLQPDKMTAKGLAVAGRQGNSSSQIPTIAAPFHSGFFMNSFVPTEHARRIRVANSSDELAQAGSDFTSDFQESVPLEQSANALGSGQDLPMLTEESSGPEGSEKQPQIGTGNYFVASKHPPLQIRDSLPSMAHRSGGTHIAMRYFDTVLSSNWLGQPALKQEKTGTVVLTTPKRVKKRHKKRGKRSKSECRPPAKATLIDHAARGVARNLWAEGTAKRQHSPSGRRSAEIISRQRSCSNSISGSHAKATTIKQLQKGIKEAFLLYKERVFTGTGDIGDASLYSMKKKMYLLNAV